MQPNVAGILARLKQAKQVSDGQWQALCPAHDDHNASLSVATGANGRVVLVCHAGCNTLSVLRAAGLSWQDVMPREPVRSHTSNGRIVATYDYRDAAGEVVFQVVRFSPKDFRQRRPDGKGGWSWSISGVPRLLYRLPELLATDQAEWVYVVEGEKDVDCLASIGATATCNPGGAGKWSKLTTDNGASDWRAALSGRRVAIIPDADQPGRDHAADVARRLQGVASEVCIVALPGGGKDAADWVAAGGTAAQLLALAESAPRFEPGAAIEGTERVFSPGDPVPIARRFVADKHTLNSVRTLAYHAGEYWRWTGAQYVRMPLEELRADVYDYLAASHRIDKRTGDLVQFGPKRASVADVIEAVQAHALIPDRMQPPCWVDDRKAPNPQDLVYCANAMLDPSTEQSTPNTPAMFSTFASSVSYDAAAPRPDAWLCFLEDLWGGDSASIETLQEWFGYCLTCDTSLQKALMIIGPKRSGKGTIQRVLAALVGERNFASMRLELLANNFALEGVLGKSVLAFPDARVTRETSHVALETLLSIVGEDYVAVNRKGRPVITTRLGCRVVVFSNELPQFSDASCAITSRFVLLRLTESFLGRENTQLIGRLLLEMPGILNWSIQGLSRLRSNGRFVQPDSAREEVELFESLVSPIGTFIAECCEVGDDHTVDIASIYSAWRAWCLEAGMKPTGKIVFARNLFAAIPHIQNCRPRQYEGRSRAYRGVGLNTRGFGLSRARFYD